MRCLILRCHWLLLLFLKVVAIVIKPVFLYMAEFDRSSSGCYHAHIAMRLCVIYNELVGFNSQQFSITVIFFSRHFFVFAAIR
jgi:hypothetical protein